MIKWLLRMKRFRRREFFTRPLAVVTTGGTKEPIDDVRYVTNFSTGKFGYAIAKALADSGYDVTVLCPPETPALAEYRIDNATHLNFRDTESLRQALLNQKDPDFIFHAAAVSDYRPKKVVRGKMSSSQQSLTIEMERTPKILSELRSTYGKGTFLVGFKLLSGVSRAELVRAALEQNRKNHLNLTVANDLSSLREGKHPVILVTAEGGAIDLFGNRDQVAVKLVEFVRRRAKVTWYHAEPAHDLEGLSTEGTGDFARLLRFAQNAHLFYDSSGNASMRLGPGLMVTPRHVDKSKVRPEEAVVAVVDHDRNLVHFRGEIKPSIDTAVGDLIFRRFPGIRYLLHFHEPWGKATVATSFPYPCGVKEEGQEILRRIGQNIENGEFSVELLHHGYLLALQDGGIERLEAEWSQVVEEFEKHLRGIHREGAESEGVIKPIFSGTHIVGVFEEFPDGSAVYVSEGSRGRGLGGEVIKQLIQRQMPIKTTDECGVVDYYRRFGFTGEKDGNSMYILRPPRTDRSDSLFDNTDQLRVQSSVASVNDKPRARHLVKTR